MYLFSFFAKCIRFIYWKCYFVNTIEAHVIAKYLFTGILYIHGQEHFRIRYFLCRIFKLSEYSKFFGRYSTIIDFIIVQCFFNSTSLSRHVCKFHYIYTKFNKNIAKFIFITSKKFARRSSNGRKEREREKKKRKPHILCRSS